MEQGRKMGIKDSTDTHARNDRDRLLSLEGRYKRVNEKLMDGEQTMDELKNDVQSLTISNVVLQQKTNLLIFVLGAFTVTFIAYIFTPKTPQPIEITVVSESPIP